MCSTKIFFINFNPAICPQNFNHRKTNALNSSKQHLLTSCGRGDSVHAAAKAESPVGKKRNKNRDEKSLIQQMAQKQNRIMLVFVWKRTYVSDC